MTSANSSFESDFYKFMKFDSSALLERYKTFVPFFKNCKKVLDLGCGRGEFLQLLKESGIKGVGIDSDQGMVRVATEKGFEVHADDLFHFVETTPERFDGIFAAHVIEHLSPENIERLLENCKRILNPGGVLILVTPNPASISAQLQEFWRDATHVRPYNLELVNYFLHRSGFEVVMSGTNFRNYASPFGDIYRPGNPPYDWPLPFNDIKYDLFTLYPPQSPKKRLWRRIIKWFLNCISKTILRNQALVIEENFRRIYYHLMTLYAPNEIFSVGKLSAKTDDKDKKSCELSIVIPNWNGKKFLEVCLNSLSKQTCKNFEIILVDNGSTDGSVEYVKTQFPSVRVIAHEKNMGFAVAVNAGIRTSNSELVFLLNNDTEVQENCVEEILKAVERYPDDSFFSCKMVSFYHRDILDGTGDCVPRNLNPFRRGQMWRDTNEFDISQHTFGACAGAAVYKKSALADVDFFDEDFFCYYEDVDISIRLQLAGYTCRYLPKAVVYHIGSATTGSTFNPIVAQCLARNKCFIFIKTISFGLMMQNIGELIKGEIGRILHFAKNGFTRYYLIGLGQAITKLPTMLKKRKKILNSAKVSNQYIQQLMMESEHWSNPDRIVKVDSSKERH